MVWNEQFTLADSAGFENWDFLLVPFLVVSQFTNYLPDGFIWKTKKAFCFQDAFVYLRSFITSS